MGQFLEATRELEGLNSPRGRPKRDACDALHTKIVWTAWAIAESGEEALRARYLIRRRSHGQDDHLAMRSDELSSYRDGRRTLSLSRQRLLTSRHPNVGFVLAWPLHLLSLREMALEDVEASIGSYVNTINEPYYSLYDFPENDPHRHFENGGTSYLSREGLYERGDAYGFIAIVAAYRFFHAQRKVDSQWHAGRDMIRALPGFCRDPRVRPHSQDAITLTKKLLQLLPDTSVPLRVDDRILWQQIEAEAHEPCRSLRLAAARSGHDIAEPADPVISFTYRRCKSGQGPMLLAGGG